MESARILIVEDQMAIAMRLEQELAQFGYNIAGVTTTGEAAIAAARHSPPDLALVDIALPGDLDGTDVATVLWKELEVPVVYLTSYSDAETIERALTSKAFAYVLKPFKSNALRTTIELTLQKVRSIGNLTQTLQVTQKTSAARAQCISVMSHECRGPLTAILSSAQIMQQYGDRLSEDRKAQHLQKIVSSAYRLNQMLQDVLELGAMDAHPFRFRPEPIPLYETCQRLVDEACHGTKGSGTSHDPCRVQIQIEQRSPAAPNSTAPNSTAPNSTAPNFTAPNFTAPNSTAPNSTAPNFTAPNFTAPNSTAQNSTAPNSTAPNSTAPNSTAPNSTAPNFTLNPTTTQPYTIQNSTPNPAAPPQEIWFKLDPQLMQLIVGNLLSNALKYSPPTHPVTLAVTCETDQVTFVVRDQGIGIPANYTEKLFQQFERATNVGNISGTGLGLSLVKQAVDCHRGQIAIASEEGKGTTVTVQLPAQPTTAVISLPTPPLSSNG
jgi:signal transduction histidine kinase